MAAAAVPFWFARTAAALCAVAWTPNPIPLLVALTAGVEVELVKVPGPVAALAIPGSASIAPTIPAVPAAAAVTMPRRVSPAGRGPGGPAGRDSGCAGSPAAALAGGAMDCDSRRSIRACCSSSRARSSPMLGVAMDSPP
jgi:hypothetical protein